MPVAIADAGRRRGRGRLAAACSGGGRSDVKRRLKVDTDSRRRRRRKLSPKKNANAVREKAARTAQEFYAKSDPENVARLRMKLIQAGYMDPRAVGTFFLIRFGGFVGFALAALLADHWCRQPTPRRDAAGRSSIMAGGCRLFPARVGADAADRAPRCASTATAFPTSWI